MFLFSVFLFVIFRETLCFCEESYVVICDSLTDVKSNDTFKWRYLLIGSHQFKREPPSHTFDSTVLFQLLHTKSLTIINQVNMITTPLAFSYASHLEHLNLYENKIGSIEDYTFQNFPKLREVYLEKNEIDYLGRAIFKNNTLDVVSLSRNKLTSITTCFYESKIRWIMINRNKLSYIKPSSFPINLEKLELDHNLLTAITERVFEDLKNLKELSIKHNHLSTVPPITALKQVQYLHFSYNNIKIVKYAFNSHNKLEYVDLSSNEIEEVNEMNIFTTKGTPPLVLLAFNRLTNLEFDNPANKTDLVLDGNPWNCDCLFNIEKILADYKHYRSCEMKNFKAGQMPSCIENGKCGEKIMKKSDVDNFVEMVSKSENKEECNFYL